MKKRIGILVGTRPEVIKMAPICSALKASLHLKPILLSSGQHREMLDQAFKVFGLKPEIDLGLMQPGQTLPDLTARVITSVTNTLRDIQLSAVLVQGDTTTVLGAALAAFYEKIPIGHVEAGLRTGNMSSPFPEEMNRRLTSPLALWNFCPTNLSKSNLIREGIAPASCHVTGNSVIDSLLKVRSLNNRKSVSGLEVAKRVGIPEAFARRFLLGGTFPGAKGLEHEAKRWVLVTGHRRESFGNGFERICEAINRLTQKYPYLGVLYPVHLNPQVQEPVMRLLGDNDHVALAKPAGYEDFIWLLDRCTFALSDSGGVQEEAPSLGKPVLVMRDSTERPEGVTAGTCTLVGTDADKIIVEASRLLDDPEEYKRRSELQNPYGDGKTAERIVKILEHDLCS